MEAINLQKVALLLIALGQDGVKKVIPFLTEKEFTRISKCIEQIDEIDLKQTYDVIKEFYEKFCLNPIKNSSESLDENMAPKIAEPSSEEDFSDMLSILENTDPKHLAEYLQKEPLLSVASMLAYLEPKRCSAIIAEMPQELHAKLIILFDQISEENKSSYLQQIGVVKFLAEVIVLLPLRIQKTALDALHQHNSDLYEKMMGSISKENLEEILVDKDTGQ